MPRVLMRIKLNARRSSLIRRHNHALKIEFCCRQRVWLCQDDEIVALVAGLVNGDLNGADVNVPRNEKFEASPVTWVGVQDVVEVGSVVEDP